MYSRGKKEGKIVYRARKIYENVFHSPRKIDIESLKLKVPLNGIFLGENLKMEMLEKCQLTRKSLGKVDLGEILENFEVILECI